MDASGPFTAEIASRLASVLGLRGLGPGRVHRASPGTGSLDVVTLSWINLTPSFGPSLSVALVFDGETETSAGVVGNQGPTFGPVACNHAHFDRWLDLLRRDGSWARRRGWLTLDGVLLEVGVATTGMSVRIDVGSPAGAPGRPYEQAVAELLGEMGAGAEATRLGLAS